MVVQFSVAAEAKEESTLYLKSTALALTPVRW